MQNRDPQLMTNGLAIGFYEREFYCFSNFSSFQVEFESVVFQTAEHLYHCCKFRHQLAIYQAVYNARSAHQAFVTAQTWGDKRRSDWDDVKVDFMYDICKAKYQQHEYVQHKLEQTGDLYMVEDSPKDSFWGWGEDRRGRNELGKIWMRIREEARE